MKEEQKLSESEYLWWQEKFSSFIGQKVTGIQLYKDEIGYNGRYFKKSEITQEECPFESKVIF